MWTVEKDGGQSENERKEKWKSKKYYISIRKRCKKNQVEEDGETEKDEIEEKKEGNRYKRRRRRRKDIEREGKEM